MDIGYVVSGDSAEELAGQLGIDADGLKAAIETWNADAASTGTDSAFGREEITPLEGTLYGYKFGVGAHYFMGGILIDENTHVLNTDGNVIEGLYAAGEVTGGFHGTQRVDGSGTGDSIVFGMIAGHSAAEAAQ
jgi:succinate dehydrogenase/fumarate reductase flavoprotein subunit